MYDLRLILIHTCMRLDEVRSCFLLEQAQQKTRDTLLAFDTHEPTKTKVSKYVGQPLSSVRWGLGAPYVASWTSSRGLLQVRAAAGSGLQRRIVWFYRRGSLM